MKNKRKCSSQVKDDLLRFEEEEYFKEPLILNLKPFKKILDLGLKANLKTVGEEVYQKSKPKSRLQTETIDYHPTLSYYKIKHPILKNTHNYKNQIKQKTAIKIPTVTLGTFYKSKKKIPPLMSKQEKAETKVKSVIESCNQSKLRASSLSKNLRKTKLHF